MTSKEIYYEVDKILLESEKPSEDVRRLIKEGKFNKPPFKIIKDLEKIDQNKKYHPEGNTLNHVLLVIDKASENKEYSKDKKVFMWSALLHDIGKLTTTRIRKGRITSYNHDIEGEKMAYDFFDGLAEDEEFKQKVSRLVKYHMQPLFFTKNLSFFEPTNMMKDTDYNEIALLSLCDRLGRGEIDEEKIREEQEKIEKFKRCCNKVGN